MPSTDAFALSHSGLNEFLYAPIGTEANGMTLSLISVFARLGDDPWREAGRLAELPKSEAIESLARIIAGMPTSLWPLPAATAIATSLIALLPTQSWKSGIAQPSLASVANVRRYLKMGLIALCVASAAAYAIGVFTPTNATKPDSSAAGFTVLPR